MEDLTNKIPLNNSIVDLKTVHNNMIDRNSQHGYFNLIANGRFEITMTSDTTENGEIVIGETD